MSANKTKQAFELGGHQLGSQIERVEVRLKRKSLPTGWRVLSNPTVVGNVSGAHHGTQPATAADDLALQASAGQIGSAQTPEPPPSGRGSILSIVRTQAPEVCRPKRSIEIGRGHLDAPRLRKRQKLELRAVGPAATPPIADSPMPDADRLRDRDYAPELLDKVHARIRDTFCVANQGGFEACLASELRHNSGMAAKKDTDFDLAAGLRLARVRVAVNLNQEDFAAKIGTTRSRVANYEQGTRTADPNVMAQLYKVYGVPTNYIYCDDMKMVPTWIADAIRAQGNAPPELPRKAETKPRRRAAKPAPKRKAS